MYIDIVNYIHFLQKCTPDEMTAFFKALMPSQAVLRERYKMHTPFALKVMLAARSLIQWLIANSKLF
jgi:hypothetical protein